MQCIRDQILSTIVLQRSPGGLLQSTGLCLVSTKAFTNALHMDLAARLIVSYPEEETRKSQG